MNTVIHNLKQNANFVNAVFHVLTKELHFKYASLDIYIYIYL